MSPADILHRELLNNSIEAWLRAALTAAIILFVALVLRRVLVKRLGIVASRTTNRIDDMVVAILAATHAWVLAVLALLIGASSLSVPFDLTAVVRPLGKLVVLWQLAVWGAAAVTFWTKFHLENRGADRDRASVAMITAMGIGAKVLLWILVGIMALKAAFSIEIAPLITGLGVGGIAVALAVQNILGDLLAALAIVFDKPFDVGDSIGVDQISGTVEHIGLKTTRLRSTTGEQIIIGNGDLLKARLRNYRNMSQRRVLFNLDVTFDTPPDVLKQLPAMVEQIVTAQQPVKFDRCHVASFSDSAIRLETVYYVLDADYKVYMNIQQAINLAVLERFATAQVKFAFPSRTVYHEGPIAKDVTVGAQPQTAGTN